MKLLRFGEKGHERPGLVDARGIVRDLSAYVADIDGTALSPRQLQLLAQLDREKLPEVPAETRIGACVGGAFKVIGVGMNYWAHLELAGRSAPELPTLFSKAGSSICGPNDAVLLPPMSNGLDWEVELGVVIGTLTRNVHIDAALDAVAAYCVVNDLTERNWIKRSGQIFDGKNGDTFTPIGPWLVTADEIEDPQDMNLFLQHNGRTMQEGNTSDMIFSIAELVSHISSLTTLFPGDIISTGTPKGIGGLQAPPIYLRPGDEMHLGVTGLGQQHQCVM